MSQENETRHNTNAPKPICSAHLISHLGGGWGLKADPSQCHMGTHRQQGTATHTSLPQTGKSPIRTAGFVFLFYFFWSILSSYFLRPISQWVFPYRPIKNFFFFCLCSAHQQMTTVNGLCYTDSNRVHMVPIGLTCTLLVLNYCDTVLVTTEPLPKWKCKYHSQASSSLFCLHWC